MVKHKFCNQCKIEKSSSCFHRQSRNKDGLQSICKTCRKLLDHDLYKNNPEKRRKNEDRRQRQREDVYEYKSKNGCHYCGESESCCLDFHHIDKNKEACVSDFLSQGNIQKMWEEIKKCIVVCANCHRKLHAGKIEVESVLVTDASL